MTDSKPSRPAPILVVAAVLEREGKVLLARRAAGQRHAGMWEFPGGKLEPGETAVQALEREIQEELGLAVEVGDRVTLCRHRGLQMEALKARILEGEPRLTVHDRLAWVEPHRLRAYPMHELDRRVVQALQ